MGKQKSLRSKAVNFVSDITTVFLNPISDKSSDPPPQPTHEDDSLSKGSEEVLAGEEDNGELVDGPDTSSFTAFLYSLWSSSDSGKKLNVDGKTDSDDETADDNSSNIVVKESSVRKSLLSRGKQSLRSAYQATRFRAYRNQGRKADSDVKVDDEGDGKFDGSDSELKQMGNGKENEALSDVPESSEPSLLLTEKTRSALYASLPAIFQGRKWLLLYSTWMHGISLSTLYRRSMLWPGLSLLVVGDRKGAVFGGLLEAPLRPTTRRRYQGTSSTFVFTDTPGYPVIFHPTGVNRYFTLCSPEFLAIGGGGHFALYLDNDLLCGSSSVSETYGNPCLAHSEDFKVKDVELWGFVYGSKYEEILALSKTEAPGICRW